MWPQNIVFFFFPAIIIIGIFLVLPALKKVKEPFGYKTGTPIKDEDFATIKNIYLCKVLLFSVPYSLALSISSMYTLSAFTGTFIMAALLLGLGAINFLFYMQAYKHVKRISSVQNSDTDEPESSGEIEELEKW